MNRPLAAVAALTAIGTLAGCVNLDEKIVSGVTASYYETAAGLEDAVRASYSGLQDLYAQERSMTMQEMGTDTWIKGADGSHKQWNDYTPLLDANTAFTAQEWERDYRAINTTNTVINRAANIKSGITETLKKQRIAEARFLRAVYYFDLVRFYGDVTLTLDETQGVVTEAKRTPAAEVYSKAIIPDLEFAIANLPATQSEYGRATKGAAQHLLALVYLTRGGANAPAADLAKAEELGKAVINSGTYALLNNYSDLFRIDNEGNKETIFSVQFTSDPLTTGNGNSWHLYYLMEYDRENGMKRTIEYGRPFKRLRPTDYLLHLHDRSKDVRYDVGFQDVWFVNNPNPSKGLALGDTSIYIPGVKTSALNQAVYCKKKYVIFTEPEKFAAPKAAPIPNCPAVKSEYDYRYFPSLAKHQDPTRSSTNETRGQRDFVVYRLADTYLLVGEALFRQGKAAEALPYFNAVRKRAAKPGKASDMLISVADLQAGGMNFILDERARELFGEGYRWFTLVRTGTLLDRVMKYNPDAAPFIKPFHVLRPIPQAQIDRTRNADGSPYTQNPGY